MSDDYITEKRLEELLNLFSVQFSAQVVKLCNEDMKKVENFHQEIHKAANEKMNNVIESCEKNHANLSKPINDIISTHTGISARLKALSDRQTRIDEQMSQIRSQALNHERDFGKITTVLQNAESQTATHRWRFTIVVAIGCAIIGGLASVMWDKYLG